MKTVNTLLFQRARATEISPSKNNSTIPALTAREKFADGLAPLISTLTSAENTEALTSLIVKLIQRPNSVISLLDSKASKEYPMLVAVAKNFHKDQLHQACTKDIEQSLRLMLRHVDNYLSDKPEERKGIVQELSLLITNLLTENASEKIAEKKINDFIKDINLAISEPPTDASLIPLVEVAVKYPNFFSNVIGAWKKLSTSFGQKIDFGTDLAEQALRAYGGVKQLPGQALRTLENVQKKLFDTSQKLPS
jgi:hypothetical protein